MKIRNRISTKHNEIMKESNKYHKIKYENKTIYNISLTFNSANENSHD